MSDDQYFAYSSWLMQARDALKKVEGAIEESRKVAENAQYVLDQLIEETRRDIERLRGRFEE